MASPKQGDTFTYTATYDFTNMAEAGTTNKVTLTVNADANAPWTAQPTAASFAWSGGAPAPAAPTVSCTGAANAWTSCTATYTNVKVNGTVTFTAQGKVSSTLGSGVLVVGTASAKVETTPTVSLAPVTSTFVGDSTGGPNDCSGTFTFSQTLSGGGAWLLDIHFADGMGQGKVQLDASAQIYAHNNNPTGSKNTIKVVDAADNDITASVVASMTYLSPDPTKPYFPGDAIQTQYPSAKWLDSVNWKWDPSTFTGDTWLPAGSTVTVTRHVTNANCASGGFTTDWTTGRPFGMSLEIARPFTTVRAVAQDSWTMPGLLPTVTCQDKVWVSTQTSGATSLYQWDPIAKSTSAALASIGATHAIAASQKWPSMVFYEGYLSGAASVALSVVDFSSGTPVSKVLIPSTSLPDTATGMAFDKDGNLFLVTATGQVYYLLQQDVQDLLDGKPTARGWQTSLAVRRTSSLLYMNNIADIAFNANGTMWLVDNAGSTAYVYQIPVTDLLTKTGLQGYTPASTSNSSPVLRGVAFAPSTTDSSQIVMYTGRRLGTTSNTLYVGAQFSTGLTNVGFTSTLDTSDFASCSFQTPSFSVQKSVINADGTITTPGTTGTPVTMSPDGTVTVTYLVTVRNTSNYDGSFPSITDQVTLPSGFTVTDVKLDGASQGSSGSFTIPGAALAATKSKSYVVTVTGRAADLGAVVWTKANTCDTTNAGSPSAGGFFNLVTMANDSDGPNNNDACVPVTPPGTAQLALIKKIVDGAGNEIAGSTDSKYFTLVAGGATNVTGSSASSGAVAVDKTVLPGVYTLAEQGNDGGATSGTYAPGDWTCVRRPTGATFTVTDRKITLVNGDNVACTITNTRNPSVKIVKDATTPDPALGNTHVGTTITPNSDGTFTANYTITVTSLSSFVSNTGPVNDYFTPPAGLVWNGTNTATIAYVPGTTGATLSPAAPSPWTATAAQLRDGLTLASSIQKLPAGASVSFTISIPLKLDSTVASGQTQSNYSLNAANLAQCTNATSAGGNKYTDTTKGIPNVVSLTGENLTYNDIPIPDNVACIPVSAPTTWRVEKAAPATYNTEGGVATWAPAGETGAAIHVASDGSATVQYRVRVTNSGSFSGTHPAIDDTLTLPAGFSTTATNVTLKDASGTLLSATNTVSGQQVTFTIPAGSVNLAAGTGYADYFVTVKATANLATLTQQQWSDAGTCVTTGPGTPGTGFFNKVTITGDTDGPNNNDACVPVTPPPSVTLLKTGPQGSSQPLTGAKFQLYGPNSQTTAVGGEVQVDANGKVTWQYLAPGTYYVKETVAPANYAVNPTLYTFTLNADGTVTVPTGQTGGSLVVSTVSGVNLEFKNAPKVTLPAAGGIGNLPFAAIGLLLMGWGAVRLRRKGVVMS